MRYLIYLLILVVITIAAVVSAQLYLNDPVFISYGAWSVEPRLALALGAFALLVLVALLFIHLLLYLLFFPLRLAEWRRHRSNEKQARLREKTMQLSVYGDRRGLLKQLAELAPVDAAATWRAVLVAEELGDTRSSGKYLRQATTSKDPIISAAAKAKLSMQENRLTEADNILQAAGAPKSAVLLAGLHHDVSVKRGDYRAALAAAMHLREQSPALHGGLVEDTVRRQLHAVGNAAAATAFWRDDVPSADRKKPALLALYLAALWRLGDEKGAADGLTQAIKQHSNDNDVLRAVVDFGTQQQLEAAFKANEKRADTTTDTALLRLLAEIADKLELTGKARSYNQKLSVLLARHDA